jgi:cytochrome P450
VPTTLSIRAQGAAAAVSRRVPSRTRVLADPPAGSGLMPVVGEYGPPLVGHSFSFLGDNLGFARRQRERFGPVSWVGGFATRMVVAVGPDAIEEVLTNRDRAFSNREGWDYVIGPFFKRSVMLMDFDEHRHHRRIMQQVFKRERLVEYLAALNPSTERGLARWQPGVGFPLYTHVKRLTLDLATDVFVGAQLGPRADRLNKSFVDAVHGGAAVVRADVPGGLWHRGLVGRRSLEEYFRAELPAKRQSDGRDLFSVLCRAESEDGQRFSDEDVVNHMIFVLMAAHDTSTATISMMAYFLAKHPDWQCRLRDESLALGKPVLDYDDLDTLKAMDMVMKETLRMFAPVGQLFRKAISDTAIQGRFVPAGTLIALGLYPTQRMTPWWSDPDRFDPERFSPERREDQSHKFAWVPFGGHAHKCIGLHFGGMEVKSILHQMLLRFSWTIPAGYEPPIVIATGPVPGDGLPIDLHPLR